MCPIRPICVLSFLAGLLAASLASAGPGVPPPAPAASAVNSPQLATPLDVAAEAEKLRQALAAEVTHLIVDGPKGKDEWIARARAKIAASGLAINRPQLAVVVDCNPRVQQMRLVLALPEGEWDDLGGTKVSTGRPGGYEHFLTPIGTFLHTDRILDWRAKGTFNAHHIKGLGVQGMRVWDFGWQRAIKGWRSRTKIGEIRLSMHATDPKYLAKRLGRPASDGCIRIPEAMNLFLDRHGVLDADYEQAAQHNPRFAGLLLPDRTPTPLAGNALVVVDSSESAEPG
jgi:hypothetical protein